MNKRNIIIHSSVFFICFGLILLLFRSLVLNIHTHLPDWNDYPLYVWIIYQNIANFLTGDVSSIFDGNIFFPSRGTLLLSDLFYPQSLVAFFLSRFLKNPLLVFNIIFFITWALNIFSAQYFWKKYTDNKYILLFAVLTTTISSYTLVNSVHFQMISYWPFLFALGVLEEKNTSRRNAFLLSLMIAVQFYSGVYLGLMLIFTLFFWFFAQIKLILNKDNFVNYINYFLITAFFSILFIGPLLYNYYLVKIDYNAVRDYSEYILYSMHLTDYLFPPHTSSLVTSTPIISSWAKFGRSQGVFPGFTVIVLFLLGFFNFSKFTISHKITRKSGFFLLLMIFGFVSSLGPRLSVNGFYTEIPLPYSFVLKFIPGLDTIRVTSRWSWLLFIGVIYFSVKGLTKVGANKKWVILAIILLFIAEMFPLNTTTFSQDYYSYENKILEGTCKNENVLVEYPMTQDKHGVDIVTNLTYRTQMMLASVHHGCKLVNGYTGWIPKDYSDFESQLFSAVDSKNDKLFFDLLHSRGADILKLNKDEIFFHKATTIKKWIDDRNYEILLSDKSYEIIYLEEKEND